MTGDNAQDNTAWSSLLEPPYPRELLAELHAGALEQELAAALWPRVRADRQADALLAGLDATVRDLQTISTATVTEEPAVQIPAHVAARIDAALAEQSAQPSPVADLATARARRRRRGIYVGIGLVAAAAVAGVVSLGAVLGSSTVSGTPQAGAPPPSSAPLPLNLGSGTPGAQALAAIGRRDLGPLSDGAVLAACLQANGVPAGTTVIGAAPVLLNGKQGILLLLPTGRTAVFTALVVGPQCAADDPATLSKVQIGPR